MVTQKSNIALQVEREHECFKRDLKNIAAEINKDVSSEDFSDWHVGMVWRLRDFRTHVLKHMDLEEEGGFMKEIINEAPETAREVERLEKEHQQITAALDNTLAALKEISGKNDLRITDVRAKVAGLVATILAHEKAENDLIQKAYYSEYGYPGAG